MAWEALVETHVHQALAFVNLLRERMPLEESLPRYLLEDLVADTGTGHNIVSTVFVEAKAMYRADGPENMKCVGEVEFVNGVAAMSASGIYGPTRACLGIIGSTDLDIGAPAGGAPGRVRWTADALGRLDRVPSFVRGMVKRIYAEWAHDRAIEEITPAVMDEARTDLGLEGM